jgi:aminoglycoside phosphotransferase (APT) family kinase protein
MVSDKPDKLIEQRLRAAVTRLLPGVQSISALCRLSGGANQETWSFICAGHDGEQKLILRRSAPGYVRPARVLGLNTEAALIELARQGGVPAPKVLGVLRDDDGLGEGFLMWRVQGETIPRKLLRDAAYAGVRSRLAYELGKILARIHSIDVLRLPSLRTLTAAAELDELFEAYRSDGQLRPVFEVAFRWLRAQCPPPPVEPCLVHGDFRTGNLMITPEGVSAVLDWELAHKGDPRNDLGWITVNSWRFGVIDNPVGGFGSRADLIRGYREAGGALVTEDEIKFWETLGTLRWGVMCLGMRRRFESGEDPSIERAMIARRTSETEIDLLRILAPRRI